MPKYSFPRLYSVWRSKKTGNVATVIGHNKSKRLVHVRFYSTTERRIIEASVELDDFLQVFYEITLLG
ncbi:MAG: hypothetical protein QXU32_00775 [Nitrososphaerales archaeon]